MTLATTLAMSRVMTRAMTLADVDAVLALERSVQAYPWTRGNFLDALDSGYQCLVEESADEIRACAVLMPGVDEAELLTLAVAAAHQRKGLGRAMLEILLALAAEKRLLRVFLEVRESNLAAIGLYRSAGFREVGVRRGYYHNAAGSEDARVMAYEFSGKSNG